MIYGKNKLYFAMTEFIVNIIPIQNKNISFPVAFHYYIFSLLRDYCVI